MPNCFPFDQHELEIYLYTLYKHGDSVEGAHDKLKKETKTECFTLENVMKHFEKIEKNEFGLKVEKAGSICTSLPLMFTFYPAVKYHILQYCDFTDRLTLRKTCQQLREAMDCTSIKFEKVTFNAQEHNCISIQDDNAYRVQYEETRNGLTVVTCKKSAALVKGRSSGMWNVASTDLRALFENKKLKIQEFQIIFPENFMVDQKINLKNLANRPKIRHLKMPIRNSDDVTSILPYLSSEYLEIIEWMAHGSVRFVNIKNVRDLEQWKNAKILISNLIFVGGDLIRDYGHFDYVDLVMENDINGVEMKDLERLKDALLLRPNLQKFELIPTRNHRFNRQLTAYHPGFGHYQDEFNKDWYHFNYPNSNDKLSLRITQTSILFKGPRFDGDKINAFARHAMRENINITEYNKVL